ncbi:kelch-like protein 15 [Haliotis rufescens]|uniref:kelch-like protein 15 n=1 Tax=Haliotis rufescens TaxID=6454 RepID=UPI001EB050CD|nr:kelch-like protein 15 [Haliotis rufescens]
MARVVPEQEQSSIPGMEFIYVTETKIKYINTKYKKVTEQMYDHNCDVKLKVAQSSFKAHKNVLMEASDYFSAMFSHDMKEKEKGVIELLDISPGGFSVILDYFYHGHVTIDRDVVADVLEAARFFHVEWLIEVCCEYLVRHLVLDDYEEVLHLAELFSLGNLQPDIFRFLADNILKLIEDPNSSFLKKLSFELLSEFLRQDIYMDISEGFLVSIILQWVDTDIEQRHDHLLPLLRLIRFPLIDIEDLALLPPSVTSSPEIMDAVEEAKQYHYDIPGQVMKTDNRFMARGVSTVTTVLSINTEQNILLHKAPEKNDFLIEELNQANIETDFETTELATVGNFLYAVGGYDPLVVSSRRLFRFDPKYRDWIELAMMAQGRVSFAICNNESRIFVFGGVDHKLSTTGDTESDTILSSSEMYDASDNSWIPLPNILTASYDQAAAIAGDNIFICGGISVEPHDPIPMGSAFKLSLATESWEPIKDMLQARKGHSMTHHNGKLFVLGGYMSTEVNTFVDCMENEMYDIETCQWTKIMRTPDSIGHVFNEANILNNMLYFVGSVGDNCFLHHYDIAADKIEEGTLIGPFVKKFCVLQMALPPQGS